MIGSLAARTLAITHAKPFYTIDHILAHIYAAGLETGRSNSGRLETRPSAYQRSASAEPDVETVSRNYSFRFPVVALVVSGGHTSLILMHSHSQHETLGATRDDAVGEAFDKVAKILGLPYPGGPSIAAAAAQARPIHPLPVAKLTGPYDFSFSGLKTAVLRLAQNLAGVGLDTPSGDLAALLSDQRKREIAASFQHTAIATLTQKLDKAIAEYHPRQIIVAGGVSASAALRAALPTAVFPAPEFSTDNAAMAAARAYYQAQFTPPDDPYDTELIPN
jgi:N6-L-threonylcarbamoyladenine synthase